MDVLQKADYIEAKNILKLILDCANTEEKVPNNVNHRNKTKNI